MTNVEINQELHKRIKRILVEFSSPIIPMSALFESLGYKGLNGILYGIILGAVSMVAIEAGFEVCKLGTIWIVKKPENTNETHKNPDRKAGEL